MRHIRSATLIACIASTSAGSQELGACRSPEAARRIGARLQVLVDSVVQATPGVPGVALTVLAPGRCLSWEGAAGVVDRVSRVPLTPGHPHRIASNTKPYVAAAILRLVEEGRLALGDTIGRHLSPTSLASLRRGGYAVDRMTVQHLLTHAAGIYDHSVDARYVAIVTSQPAHRWSRAEQLDSAMVWGTAYGPPGRVFHYSDTGYILLGEMIERITGWSLARALRTLLHFDGLGLTSTWLESLEPPPAGVPDRAHQYLGEVDTFSIDPSFDLYGGGGLAATTTDMARFTRALFRGGVFARGSTIGLMTTVPPLEDATRHYGLGVSRTVVAGEVLWGHSGFWNTFSHHAPALDVTIAASITQQGRQDVARAVLQGALRALAMP